MDKSNMCGYDIYDDKKYIYEYGPSLTCSCFILALRKCL